MELISIYFYVLKLSFWQMYMYIIHSSVIDDKKEKEKIFFSCHLTLVVELSLFRSFSFIFTVEILAGKYYQKWI